MDGDEGFLPASINSLALMADANRCVSLAFAVDCCSVISFPNLAVFLRLACFVDFDFLEILLEVAACSDSESSDEVANEDVKPLLPLLSDRSLTSN